MAAALPRNFCKIMSALLHTRIWALFGRGSGYGSKFFFKCDKMTLILFLFATLIGKVLDPFEIWAAKSFRPVFTVLFKNENVKVQDFLAFLAGSKL